MIETVEGEAPKTRKGENWTSVDVGPFAELKRFRFIHPALPIKSRGKVFLADLLQTKGMEISMNSFPAGASMPFLHAHKENEELYLFLAGEGEMLVDGETVPVREGSAVRVLPKASRAWRNTGSGPIQFLCMQWRADSAIPTEVADGVYLGPTPWLGSNTNVRTEK